ncbi:MAG: family 78 glycoside hydrolase catalytic domain [Clostridia bacterium]|nr:family 78 glycoside hydrolase catalytic domain [Clostridia bacterium]
MKWIWLKDSDEHSVNTYGEFIDAFRITFDCPQGGIDSAKTGDTLNSFLPGDKMLLRICADSQYTVWINGRYAASGQYADFPDAKVYDELDISEFLHEGENALRFMIYYQGISSSTYLHGEPGFCYSVANGEKVLAESSSHTLGRLSPAYRSGPMEMVSGQLGYAFEYDASALLKLEPYYPAAESDMALCFAEYPLKSIRNGEVPLYPRPIKKLRIGPPAPAKIVTQGLFGFSKAEAGLLTSQRLQRAALSQRYAKEIIANFRGPEPRIGGCESPEENDAIRFLHEPVTGYAGIYVVVDLERETAGYFHIDIDAPKGTKVYIGYGEHLTDLRVRTFVGGRSFTGVYTCRGGRESFTHTCSKRLGLRYMQIFVASFDFRLFYAGVRSADYPLTDICGFRSSDSLHNKIYEVSLETLRLCMHEHYEDCPWREQALYAMDSRNQMLSGYYAFGEYDFPKASLRLLGHSLRADGMLELCAPAKVPVSIPSFSLMWIVELYEYVLYSGDHAFAAEEFPIVTSIIREFWTRSRGRDQLPPCRNRGDWNFYEWSDWMSDSVPAHLRREGEVNTDAPLTLFYALALDAASKLAGWLIRRHADNDEFDYRRHYSWYEMLHDSVIAGFHDTYWDPERAAYATYIVNGERVHFSELTHALALYAGAVPEKFISRVAELLTGEGIPLFAGYAEEAERIAPGCPKDFVPATLSHSIFKYEALMKCGEKYAAYVLDDIADKWGRMLYNGATSFWEVLEGACAFDDAGSLCHGWSAIPVIIYGKYVLGIYPTRPGFADFEFKPLSTPLLKARGRVPLPKNEAVTVDIAPGSVHKSTVKPVK